MFWKAQRLPQMLSIVDEKWKFIFVKLNEFNLNQAICWHNQIWRFQRRYNLDFRHKSKELCWVITTVLTTTVKTLFHFRSTAISGVPSPNLGPKVEFPHHPREKNAIISSA